MQKHSLNYEGKHKRLNSVRNLTLQAKILEFNANLSNIPQKEFEEVYEYIEADTLNF